MKYADEHTIETLVDEIKGRYQPKGNYLTQHQDISGKADLASPTLTGVPKAPTAGSATSTTQIATTQFVQQEIDRRANDFHFTVGSGNFALTEVESITSIL